MKKVIIFSTAYYPFVGGAEVAIKELTDRIGDLDFDLITARIDKNLPKTEKIGNVNIYRVGFGLKYLDKFLLPFLGYLKAKNLHRTNHYDSAWSMMASQASIGSAFLKKKFPDIKLVLTLQEGDEEDHLKRYVLNNNTLYKLLIRPWHELVFKRADNITVISNYLADRARSKNEKAPIVIIPNGVDIKNFSQNFSEEEIKKIRAELGVSRSEVLVIHTGRYVLKNGLDDLVKSLEYLSTNVKLLLLGRGQDKDELITLAKEKNLQERVIFHDYVDHAVLPKFLKASDIFCRPSLSEGLGCSFLEAMAASLPVIATPVGGIPDFLFDKETGLFCQVRDSKSIAEAVKLYVNNQTLKNDIVQSAFELVISKYNWDEIAKEMKKQLTFNL